MLCPQRICALKNSFDQDSDDHDMVQGIATRRHLSRKTCFFGWSIQLKVEREI
jgi:hypothetical protein